MAPPGSGYCGPEDEPNQLPLTYEPMMEHPGTMRPGRTGENSPYEDLPLDDDDEEPIPWPHFQQIEWHHRWPPPHPHLLSVEQFIESIGRWATPEEEAQVRLGARRSVREARERAESKGNVIVDDDEEEVPPEELGEGMFAEQGRDTEMSAVGDTMRPKTEEELAEEAKLKDEEEEDDDDDGALDDFLLDLGLDTDPATDEDTDIMDQLTTPPPTPTPKKSGAIEAQATEGASLVRGLDMSAPDALEKSQKISAALEADKQWDAATEGDSTDDEFSGDDTTRVNADEFGAGESSAIFDEDAFDDGGFDFGDIGDVDDFDDGGFGDDMGDFGGDDW